MVEIFEQINQNFPLWARVLYFIVLFVVGLFVYWKAARRRFDVFTSNDTEKGPKDKTSKLWLSRPDKDSQMFKQLNLNITISKLFDYLVISLIVGVFISRVLYILYDPTEFADIRWFYIPYEKIDDQVFWFSSFPWVMFNLGVGSVIPGGFLLGFLLCYILLLKSSVIKLNQNIKPLTDFIIFTLIGIGFFFSITFKDVSVFYLSLAYAGLLVVRFFLIKQNFIKLSEGLIKRIFNFIFIVSVPSLLIYKHLTYDHPNSEFLLVVDIAGLFVTLWLSGVDISNLVFGKQEEEVIGVKKTDRRQKSFTQNKVSTSEVKPDGRRRDAGLKKNGKNGDKPRDFSMSYRHFRSSVENSFLNRVKRFLQKIKLSSKKSEVDQRDKNRINNETK